MSRPQASRACAVTMRLAAVTCVTATWWAGAAGAGPTPPPLPAHFSLTGSSQPLPASFLGLSVEFNTLLTYEREGALFDRVIRLIRPEDGAPLLLRIGGKSADHTLWEPGAGAPSSEPYTVPRPADAGVQTIGYGWLTRLAPVVARNRLDVMLDLNLAVHSPKMAVSFARAAIARLPSSSVVGLEVGNEPDLYWRQPDLDAERVATTAGVPRDWTRDYSAIDYRRDYIAYAGALKAAIPALPLGGPEAISDDRPYLTAVEGLGRLDAGFVTLHRYASSTCWSPSSPFYPSIPRLLSAKATTGLAQTVKGAVALAHANHQALRVTEANSISCGGNPGVADSFATALWAPDALLSMAHVGADSVSWHIRPDPVNAPFHPTPAGIRAMPELYGLAAFAQMTRPGAELLGSTLANPAGLNLSVWAVRFNGGMRVLLIDKDARSAEVSLNLGETGSAYLRRLEAPSIGATSGVTFGGQAIGADGLWHGKVVAPAVPDRGGDVDVVLPAYSAALLSIWR